MLDRLSAIERHYEELGQQLLEVGADYRRAAELSKERSDLEPVVGKSREYAQALTRLEEARGLLGSETDPEMRSLAEAEVQDLTVKTDTLEQDMAAGEQSHQQAVHHRVLSDDDPTKSMHNRKIWLSHRDLIQLVEKSLRGIEQAHSEAGRAKQEIQRVAHRRIIVDDVDMITVRHRTYPWRSPRAG